ncbi:MAG: 5-formyltetrahydrofolate cyclo-ligase [Rubrobacter sp.]
MERQETKARLREVVLGRRDAMESGTRAALSGAIVREIITLAGYEESRTVMAYAGFGSELQTDAFLRHTLSEGKRLLLPRVNRQERLLDVYEVKDPARDLEAGTWGIREPILDLCAPADPSAAEFVLVPGLAFDSRGGRLGYGAGFYDKLLSASVSPRAWLVAGAFEAQMVQEVPLAEHDVLVDLVVTEKGQYPPGPPRKRTIHRSP